MTQVRARFPAWALLFLCLAAAAQAADSTLVTTHPRLLFTAGDLPTLRAKVTDNPDDFDDNDYARIQNWATILLGRSPAVIAAAGVESYGLYNVPILGMAYQMAAADDARKGAYQQKCKDVLTYLAQTYGPSATDAHNSSLRLFVLALGFDLCFDTLAVPPADPAYPADRRLVADGMLAYLDPALRARFDWRCREFPPYTSNGSVLVGAATGLAALVLRGETTATAWLDSALAWAERVVEANLNSIFDPAGGANEGELYGPFALRFLVPYAEARRRYDGLDLGARPELRNFDQALAFAVLPNGFATQANDGNYSELGLAWNDTYTNWCQSRYQSQLGRWVYAQLAPRWPSSQRDWMASVLWNQGPPTVPLTTLLPDSYLARRRGFYVYRTGFTAPVPGKPTDTVFTFYAGRFGGGHAQEDQGTFTLFAAGTWYLPDFGYSRAPYTASKESEAHNLVFIDGRGQHSAGGLIGTDGNISHDHLGAFCDYLQADLRAAYSTHSPLNEPGVPWPGVDWSWGYDIVPNTVQQALRHVLVVKRAPEAGEYFVIADDLDKDGLPHTFDWTLHTGTENAVETAANPLSISPPACPGQALHVFFASPSLAPLAVTSAIYPRYAADPDTRRLRATLAGAVAPCFLVTLVPTQASPSPRQEVLQDVDGGAGVRLSWPSASDDILFRHRADRVQAGGLASDAALVLVRRHANGAVRKFTLAVGTSLRDGDADLVNITGGPGSVTSDGWTVEVSDPALQYTVWGPQVVAVAAARAPLPFVREGPFVYVGAPPAVPIDGDSVQADLLDPTSVAITWRTPFPADGRVVFGGSPECRLASARDTCLATQHTIVLRHLCQSKKYHFRVVSQGAAHHARSALHTFSTLGVTPAAGRAPAPRAGRGGGAALATAVPGDGAPADLPDCLTTDTGADPAAEGAALTVLTYPNPARDRVVFSLPALGRGTSPRVAVFDAAGRLVCDLGTAPGGGPQQLGWDGRTASGLRAAPGVYFVRLAVGGRTATARFTLLQ